MPLKLYRENLTKTKDNWPLHVFFISLGSPLFGVGFAALPVILLLIWLVFELKRHPGELIKVIRDERNFWIWVFYFLFFAAVFVSDIVNKSKLSNSDGILYSLAIGVFIACGSLLSRRNNARSVLALYSRWMTLWTVFVLSFVEFGRYKSGIFDNPNLLFSGIAMLGLLSLVFFMENKEHGNISRGISLACWAWSFSSILRYSTSDALLPVFIVSSLFLGLVSENKRVMSGIFVIFISGALYVTFNEPALNYLDNINIVDIGFWRRFFNQRESIWTVTMRILSRYPLLGVGSGHFGEISRNILAAEPELKLKLPAFAQTHSIWLQHFAAHGIPGGICFVGVLLSSLRCIVKCYRHEHSVRLTLAILGIYMVYSFYGFVEYVLFFEELIPLVWGSLGLLMGRVTTKGCCHPGAYDDAIRK